MYFTKVEFHNYGIYKGTHEMVLTDRQGDKNITLVGGLNGRGKTTFHDGILIALYGKQSLNYIQEKTRSYDKLLKEHINKHATDDRTYVAVTLILDDESEIRIQRTWKLRNGKIEHKIQVEKNGTEDKYLADNWNYYIEEILPFGIARFFFFNNEKITQLADDASFEQIRGSIKSALGISAIEDAIMHTDQVIRRKQKALDEFQNSEQNQNYQETERELSALDQKLSELTEKLKIQELDWQKKAALAEEKEKEFWASGGELGRKRDAIRAEIKLIEQEIDRLKNEVLHVAADPSTPLFMCRNLVGQSYEDICMRQDARTNRILEERISDIYRRLMDVLKDVNIPEENMENVKNIFSGELKEHSQEESQSLKIQATETDLHLFEKLLSEVFPRIIQKISVLVDSTGDHESRLMNLKAHLEVGEDKEEAITNLYDTLKSLEKESNTAEHIYEETKNAIEDLNKQKDMLVGRRIKLIKGMAEKENANDDNARMIRYSAMGIQAMEKFKIRLQEEKAEELSQRITSCFMELVEKTSLVRKIEVDPENLDVRLVDVDGNELYKSQLSAGEQQMFAVSVIWALALISGYKAPVIIDTPMGRLDSSHRANFVTKYLPTASSQVLVLSTDTEIRGRYFDMIKDRIVDGYTLVYKEEEQCTSIVHGYFGEEAE